MQISDLTKLETLFLALGDKTRLQLLSLMADGPVPVGLLVEKTGQSQPKVSRHLAYLRNCGVVMTSRDGKWIYYEIDYGTEPVVRQMLEAVIGSLCGKSSRPRPPVQREKLKRTTPRREIYVDPDMAYVPEEYEEVETYEPEPTVRQDEDAEMDVFLL